MQDIRSVRKTRQRKQQRFERYPQMRFEYHQALKAEYLHPQNTKSLRVMAEETGYTFARIGQIARGECKDCKEFVRNNR